MLHRLVLANLSAPNACQWMSSVSPFDLFAVDDTADCRCCVNAIGKHARQNISIQIVWLCVCRDAIVIYDKGQRGSLFACTIVQHTYIGDIVLSKWFSMESRQIIDTDAGFIMFVTVVRCHCIPFASAWKCAQLRCIKRRFLGRSHSIVKYLLAYVHWKHLRLIDRYIYIVCMRFSVDALPLLCNTVILMNINKLTIKYDEFQLFHYFVCRLSNGSRVDLRFCALFLPIFVLSTMENTTNRITIWNFFNSAATINDDIQITKWKLCQLIEFPCGCITYRSH